MNASLSGFAKRLGLSLVLLSALGGCAVYGPPPGSVIGTDANGQPIYAPPYSYDYPGYPYYPYYYNPLYIGGPVFFGYGYHRWGGWGGHGGGHGGGHWGGHGGGGHHH